MYVMLFLIMYLLYQKTWEETIDGRVGGTYVIELDFSKSLENIGETF